MALDRLNGGPIPRVEPVALRQQNNPLNQSNVVDLRVEESESGAKPLLAERRVLQHRGGAQSPVIRKGVASSECVVEQEPDAYHPRRPGHAAVDGKNEL